MRKKQALKWIALACVGVMLAGCSDQGAVRDAAPSESSAVEITRQEEGKDGTQASQVQENDGTQASQGQENDGTQGQESDEALTQGSDGTQTQESEAEAMEDVALEKITVDPMELKSHYEKAAFFADWAYVKKPGNTIVSPMSLNMALGLAAAGASGETAAEMNQYLGREDFEAYAKEYMNFADGLAADQGSSKFREGYSFHYEIANSIWINQRHQILEDYRKKMEECFHAEVRPGDFGANAPETVQKINDWCSEKTHGMIPKILSDSDLSDEDKAVLINSLYFESPWVNKWALTEDDFTDFGGNVSTQEMLRGGADQYYENDKAIAFGKNYYNGFRFIGILPKTEGEFGLLDLDLESLLASESSDYLVRALMPKLNFNTTADNLQELLIAQGIKAPFDPNVAQFDKIIDGEELFISRIIQKCKIELDDKGTKAAAVTAITMRANAIAPMEKEIREVLLNRPFAFLIYDSVNEEIVFAGKVTNVK